MQAMERSVSNRELSIPDRLLVIFLFLMAGTVALTASAQDRSSTAKSTSGAAKQDRPEARPVKLKTKDGVELRAFYLPSKLAEEDRGKEAITVIIIHEWRSQASPYGALGYALQDAGCAVLIPDYRAHGGSKDYVDEKGRKQQFNVQRMSRRDIEKIMTMDLEAAKKFLVEENNEGKLNLNALVVIGVQEGCVFAGRWSQSDWQFQTVGRRKQGQDVKALVFVSPEKQIKGVPLEPALKDGNLLKLPLMIVSGNRSSEAPEANRIAKRVESLKRRMGKGNTTGFKVHSPDSRLSGSRLVNDVSSVIPAIVEFIESEIEVSDDENPWVERI